MTKTEFVDAVWRLNAQHGLGLYEVLDGKTGMTISEIAGLIARRLWMTGVSHRCSDDTRLLFVYLNTLHLAGCYEFDAEPEEIPDDNPTD